MSEDALAAASQESAAEAAHPAEGAFPAHLQHAVSAAALGVFTLSNLAGLWLAALLVWPRLGALAGPLTYGRWVPVHLNLQLFGWCSLPAVGLLLARFLPPAGPALRFAQLALGAWVAALVAGGAAWLAGGASGKLFLDWTGPAAWSFAGAQALLWLVLAGGWIARGRLGTDGRGRRAGDLLLVVALAAVPVSLLIVERVDLYPPVNPHSGGGTGHSLLASSLGIIAIAIALPVLLGRRARRPMLEPAGTVVAIYAAHWVVHGVLNHGNASHHDLEQVAGLGTLAVWPPVLAWWFRQFSWEECQRPWLLSLGLWSVLLVLDGFAVFLPGVLEGVKFTNALVAHSHLAMAGLLTSLNLLILVSLAPRTNLARVLAGRRAWAAWNGACLGMIALLTALGWMEGRDPMFVPTGGRMVDAFYLGRLACGFVMFAATLPWLAAVFRPEAVSVCRDSN
jgi:cytochrome c oxidase cbb3-type subunit I